LIKSNFKDTLDLIKMPKTLASKIVTILNQAGFHVRPITTFTLAAAKFQSEIKINYQGQIFNGKSALECTTIAAPCGAEFTIEAEGDDAELAVKTLAELVENKFELT
jgi:phosphocarrier protein HPr